MKYCIICKHDDFEEHDMDPIVHFVCTQCGFVHAFHQDYYYSPFVDEVQEKQKEHDGEIDHMHQMWLNEE